ncbi:hypothetical protein TNCV_2391631 [Trichonephila clavipes]|nr:hypothetical protein TNCV_2391631 [Trichonephila clavipes]
MASLQKSAESKRIVQELLNEFLVNKTVYTTAKLDTDAWDMPDLLDHKPLSYKPESIFEENSTKGVMKKESSRIRNSKFVTFEIYKFSDGNSAEGKIICNSKDDFKQNASFALTRNEIVNNMRNRIKTLPCRIRVPLVLFEIREKYHQKRKYDLRSRYLKMVPEGNLIRGSFRSRSVKTYDCKK